MLEDHKNAIMSVIGSRQPVSGSEMWQIIESVLGTDFDADVAQEALDVLCGDGAIHEDRAGNWSLFDW